MKDLNNMCGFNFIYDVSQNKESLSKNIRKMNALVEHRGPDENNIFVHDNIAFGHLRLSILDLSAHGSQPMRFAHLTLLFNGEIYNYRDLKAVLDRERDEIKIDGTSDTEIVLKFIYKFGILKFLTQARGMFSFLVHDRLLNKIYLARDHYGQKPLHYFFKFATDASLSRFIVSSEIKAISDLENDLRLNRDSIAEYLSFGYISAPKTIYEEIQKLKPGVSISIDLKTGQQEEIFNYSPASELKNETYIDFKSQSELISYLDDVVGSSVERHLISDVPVASLLSGGTDSTLMALYAKERSLKPIEAFTIGFDDSHYDESRIAEINAKNIGIKHNSFVLNSRDIMNAVSESLTCFSEPFGDPSALVSNLVYKEVGKSHKVVLSGDGGDELFGGYSRYKLALRLHSLLSYSKHSYAIIKFMLDNISKLEKITPDNRRIIYDKIDKLYNKVNRKSFPEFYAQFQMHSGEEVEYAAPIYSDEKIEHMLLTDIQHYLPSDLLVKSDLTSMRHSVEVRCPFVDVDLVHSVWKIPSNHRIKQLGSKALLRDLIKHKNVNVKIPNIKRGFAVPLKSILEEFVLNEIMVMLKRYDKSGLDFINTEKTRIQLDQYLNGYRYWHRTIWNKYILLKWLYNNRYI